MVGENGLLGGGLERETGRQTETDKGTDTEPKPRCWKTQPYIVASCAVVPFLILAASLPNRICS